MAAFKAKQIARITDAVAEARQALRAQRHFVPAFFAEVFIAHDGVQVPGQPDAVEQQARLAELLQQRLREGAVTDSDPDLARELKRAYQESHWAEALESEAVVGFRVQLPAGAEKAPACQAALKADHGFGPGVFRRYAIVVLPPDCDGASFVPVYEHEIES